MIKVHFVTTKEGANEGVNKRKKNSVGEWWKACPGELVWSSKSMHLAVITLNSIHAFRWSLLYATRPGMHFRAFYGRYAGTEFTPPLLSIQLHP